VNENFFIIFLEFNQFIFYSEVLQEFQGRDTTSLPSLQATSPCLYLILFKNENFILNYLFKKGIENFAGKKFF